MRPLAPAKSWTGYLIAALGIAVASAVLKLFSSHSKRHDRGARLLAGCAAGRYQVRSQASRRCLTAGVLCFNYFFLPPFHTLTIAAPDNWIALIAFLVTAITVGQLSAHAKGRAEEADAGRRQIEQLYEELKMHSSEPVTRKLSSRARN